MLRTWLRRCRRRLAQPAPRPAASRPLVELLEDRRLLNAGTLDPFFGQLGRTVTADFASGADAASATAFQSDGKLIVAGTSAYGPTSNAQHGAIALARYTADGSLDPTFGIGGRATAFFGPDLTGSTSVSVPTVGGIAIQSDGKIVVAGSVSGGLGENFALVRFTANGWLDPTFGSGGEVITPFPPQNSFATSVTIQSDGKIIAAGQAEGNEFALARYNTDGSLDTNFGNGGLVANRLSTGDIDAAEAVTVQPDGQILIAGYAGNFRGHPSFALERYNGLDGSLDTNFGTGGAVTTDFGTVADARAVEVLPDGIRVAGKAGAKVGFAQYSSGGTVEGTETASFLYTFAPTGEGVSFTPSGQVVVVGSTGGPTSDFVAKRYDAFGNVDTNFGSGGVVTTNFGGNDAAFAVAGNADGTLAIVGRTNSNNGDFAAARYNADGSPLTSFGSGGQVTTDFLYSAVDPTNPDFGPPALTSGFTAALPGGSLLVAGTVAPAGPGEFLLARYTASGALDTSFGSGGEVVTSFGPGTSASAAGIAVESDGRIVVAGTVFGPTGVDVAVAVYTANGQLDTSFGGTGTLAVAFPSGFAIGGGVAVQHDGKIVVVGTTPDVNTGDNDWAVARINPDGTLDSGFGTAGEVTSDFGPDGNTDFGIGTAAASVVVLPGGQILLGGTAPNPNSPFGNDDLAVARYSKSGVLDATFGAGGLALADFAGPSVGSSLAVAPGGAIVIGGTTLNVNGATGLEQDFALARFTAAGAPDTTFGGGTGEASFSFDGQIYDGAAVAIQSDGKIVIAGTRTDTTTFNSDFAVARVNTDGTLDTTFGNGGLVTTDFGGTDVAAGVVLTPDGRIIVGGSTYGTGGGDLALACYYGDHRNNGNG